MVAVTYRNWFNSHVLLCSHHVLPGGFYRSYVNIPEKKELLIRLVPILLSNQWRNQWVFSLSRPLPRWVTLKHHTWDPVAQLSGHSSGLWNCDKMQQVRKGICIGEGFIFQFGLIWGRGRGLYHFRKVGFDLCLFVCLFSNHHRTVFSIINNFQVWLQLEIFAHSGMICVT